MHGIAIYAMMFLFSEKNVIVYTYFQKGCRGERRMAVVKRKLHDRKELWFPFLVRKKNLGSLRGAKLGGSSNRGDNGSKKHTNLHIGQ